jgi:hypothetical protein
MSYWDQNWRVQPRPRTVGGELRDEFKGRKAACRRSVKEREVDAIELLAR